MNLTEKEQKLLTLILNNAASDGEILNARKAFIRSIGSKNIFTKSYTNSNKDDYKIHELTKEYNQKIFELTKEFNKLRETAIKIEKERNDLYRQNQNNYRLSLNYKEEVKELKEKLSRKKQIDKDFNVFSIFFGLVCLFILFQSMFKIG